ncbi:hypothetical protein X798_05272, partial [Onchocerca flexuosa]
MWARILEISAAFFIYAALTMVAFVFFFIFLSETKGTSLEDLEMGTKVNRKPMTLKCSGSFFQQSKQRETNAIINEKTNLINRN